MATLLLATVTIAQETEAEKAATRDYVVAQGFQKKRLFADAATHWKKFLTTHTKSVRLPAVRLNLAVCQLQLKQYPGASQTLRQLLKLNPQYKLADRVQYNLGLAMDNIAVGSGKARTSKQLPSNTVGSQNAIPRVLLHCRLCTTRPRACSRPRSSRQPWLFTTRHWH